MIEVTPQQDWGDINEVILALLGQGLKPLPRLLETPDTTVGPYAPEKADVVPSFQDRKGEVKSLALHFTFLKQKRAS